MYGVDDIIYECPVEALSSILGKKWVGSIIWALQKEKKRFGELERSISGCSKKMLSQQLELLIAQGIMVNDKKIENNTVESVYYLSEAGLLLLPVMEKMIGWSNENLKCGE